MKRYKTLFTRTAQEDQLDIVRYIADDLKNPDAARGLVEAFRDAVDALAEAPLRYPLLRDTYLAKQGYRFVRVKSYLLFYRIDQDAVTVIRILYAKMNWERLLK